MYCDAFNLKEKPFSLAADPRYLYMSGQHWEAMAHLMYGVQDDWGFVLITGEIGTGKTTLCRLLLEQMPEDVEVAFLLNPRLAVQELLVSICEEFRIQPSSAAAGTKELFDLISGRLIEIHAMARKALLIIDEAQYLTSEVMDELRLLTNLETEGGKLLRIILLGQPELRDKLARPELEQMSQRITARFHLGPLSRKDVAAYVSHRMTLAGADRQFFTPSAIRVLFRISRGVPRLINVICERALLGACMKKDELVRRSTMIQAGHEVLRGSGIKNGSGSYAALRWAVSGAAVVMLGALIFISGYDGAAIKAESGPQLQSSNEAVQTSSAGATAAQWWPVDLGFGQSRDAAYKDLLIRKGITYNSSSPLTADTICADMELFNLQCMQRRRPVPDLKTLPVPVAVKLRNIQGRQLFVVFKGIKGGKALLSIAEEDKEVAVSDVMALWTGNYTAFEPIGAQDAVKRRAYASESGRIKD